MPDGKSLESRPSAATVCEKSSRGCLDIFVPPKSMMYPKSKWVCSDLQPYRNRYMYSEVDMFQLVDIGILFFLHRARRRNAAHDSILMEVS